MSRRITTSQITALLTARSHVDRVMLAICDLLRNDPVIAHPDFCGDAEVPSRVRVFRVSDAQLTPRAPWPMITVFPQTEGRPWVLQGDTEVSLLAGIRVHYRETRLALDDTLGAEEQSHAGILHHIRQVLTSTRDARGLRVERYRKDGTLRPLVDGEVAANSQYADIYTGNEIIDDNGGRSPDIVRVPELQLEYKYVIDRDTGQMDGFDPDE